MNENKNELKQQKLKEYEDRYKKEYQDKAKEIEEATNQKLISAHSKMDVDFKAKTEKIKKQIVKQQALFKEEIVAKYDKLLLNQQKRCEDQLQREKKEGEKIEYRLIEMQRRKSKDQVRVQQMQKQRNNYYDKIKALEKKIEKHEAELMAYERLKI